MLNYALVFILLIGVEMVYLWLSRTYRIFDSPNLRSSHVSPTIRGGGIIFPIAVFLWFFLEGKELRFVAGLMMISIVSLIDDIRGLGSLTRIIVHFVAAILLLWNAGVQLPVWFYFPSVVLIIGIINAYNFMDGINGITGLYTLTWLMCCIYLNVYLLRFIDDRLLAYLVAATVIFLFFNFRKKAVCFGGDVGSVSIAFIAAFVILRLTITLKNPLPLLFLSIYGIDCGVTMTIRGLRRENILEAHRSHLFQIIANERGVDHRAVSVAFAATQLAINAIGIFFYFYLKVDGWYIFSGLIILQLAAYFLIRRKMDSYKSMRS